MAEKIKEYVVFQMGEEYYGININFVENIEKTIKVTRVPYTESFVEGVINLRGNVVPVVNLMKRIGLRDTQINANSRTIIINYNEYKVGLIVGSSSEVVQLTNDAIEKTPEIVSKMQKAFVKNVGKEDDRIIILLNIERVLDLEEAKK